MPPILDEEAVQELDAEGGEHWWTHVVSKKFRRSAAMTEAIKNAHEEEQRAKSLVVSGMPERSNDRQDISDILQCLDPSLNGTVVDCFRMGVASAGRARVMKVHLVSSHCVKAALAVVRHLKQFDWGRGIFIRRSMPYSERQASKKLRKKCDTMNKDNDDKTKKFVVLTDGDDERIWCYDGVDKYGRGGTKGTDCIASMSDIISKCVDDLKE